MSVRACVSVVEYGGKMADDSVLILSARPELGLAGEWDARIHYIRSPGKKERHLSELAGCGPGSPSNSEENWRRDYKKYPVDLPVI